MKAELFMIHNSNERGISVAEVIIAIAVVSTVFFAIAQVSILALRASADRNTKAKALAITQEGMEAVRSIRDASWTTNIAGLTFAATYYITASSSQWTLTQANPGLIENKFTRTVILDNVSRNINDDIVDTGGTNDIYTKKITVTVLWGSQGKNMKLVGYIMDILKN